MRLAVAGPRYRQPAPAQPVVQFYDAVFERITRYARVSNPSAA